jgi:hypothetical protein
MYLKAFFSDIQFYILPNLRFKIPVEIVETTITIALSMISFVLNLITACFIYQTARQKKRIVLNRSRSINFKKSNLLVIVLMSLIDMPYFYYRLHSKLFDSDTNSIITPLGIILKNLSHSANIFIFWLFHKEFRSCFLLKQKILVFIIT